MFKIISQIGMSLYRKGLFFYLNLFVFYILLVLIVPLFSYRSSYPFFFGYSLKYLIYLAFYVGFAAVFLLLILANGKRFNRILFFSIVAVLLVSDAVWLVRQMLTPFKLDYYHPKPYVLFTGRPNYETSFIDRQGCFGGGRKEVRLNEMGFRVGRPLSKQKPDGEIRIFMVGGSTVYNGFPLYNTIPGQLEELFHINGFKNVRVYNFGVIAYVSGQEVSLILHTISDYQPDLVIMYDGANDVHEPYSYDPRPGYPYNFMTFETGYDFMRGTTSWRQLFFYVLSRNRLINMAFGRSVGDYLLSTQSIKKEVDYQSRNWEIAVVREYVSNLEKSCGLAKGFNFKLAVFLQPLIYFKSPLVGRENALLVGREYQDYMVRQYERIRPIFDDLNKKYADEKRCFFFDISDAFKGYDKQAFFWDFIHTGNEGNRFIAEKIYSCLDKERVTE